MFNMFLGFLLKIRDFGQKFIMGIFEKFRGADGKVMGISPKGLKLLVITILSVSFIGIVISQLFSPSSGSSGGLETYQKEHKPKTGLGDTEAGSGIINPTDPLRGLDIRSDDPLANFFKADNTKSGGLIADTTGNLDAQGNVIPTISECLDIFDKMKLGTVLSAAEQQAADVCIDQNIAQLTQEELALTKALLEENKAKAAAGATSVTPPSALERILRNSLDGSVRDGTTEARIADLVKAGKLEEAQAIAAALEAKNQALADALLARAEGLPLTADQQRLLDAFDRLQANAGARGADGTSGTSGTSGIGGAGTSGINGVDQEATARQMAKEIAEREERLKEIEREMERARQLAAQAAEKLARGVPLTKEEEAALKRLADLQKEKDELMAAQKRQQEALAKLLGSLRETLARVSATMTQVYPSGITVVNFDEDDCKAKPLPFKKAAKKTTKKKTDVASGELVLGLDGKPLTPDKIKYLRLYQKNKAQEDRDRMVALNPGDSFLGEGSRLNSAGGEEILRAEIAQSFIFTNRALKQVNLTANMKIPAILDSEIMVSDKGSSQVVRIRILEDVRNPDNNVLVFPKGSIAVGRTSGFDAETGLMDFTLTKVIVGAGKTIEINLQVGSSDGSMGLKGQIRDTQGNFLLGAFITTFTAGALNWFSQQVVQPFQEETDAGSAFMGAGAAGGAEVANRIAELYSAKLQQAARIFWVPKGVPVILFPE